MVVMYTLKRGSDGRLHGPINKKVWGSFAGRKAAAQWARAQAAKRGFDPDTSKTVQIVLDGANSLKSNMQRQFPKAIFTMDVWHVVERLWSLGRHFHKEGSKELEQWVEELKTLLYGGKVAELVERLRELLRQEPLHGPGTKGRRKALRTQITFLHKRVAMMQYDEWRKQDLVIGSGQVEGAVRHVVGERMDCAGMRWVQGKGEALLHLRCIEINGDWDAFGDWLQSQTGARLRQCQSTRILTDQPIRLQKAA